MFEISGPGQENFGMSRYDFIFPRLPENFYGILCVIFEFSQQFGWFIYLTGFSPDFREGKDVQEATYKAI